LIEPAIEAKASHCSRLRCYSPTDCHHQRKISVLTQAHRKDTQLTLGNSGKLEAVKILGAQLKDREFRKAVAAEAARWNFTEIAPAATVIECPLLFVCQGMDITTLVNWEKTLRGPGEERVSRGSPR
jgi:hypothetical protein